MAWNTKFYSDFYDSEGVECRVDIMEDGTPSAVELDAKPSPIKIILPEIKDKLQPVRGSGCELNLYSTTDRQLQDLFTADIQQYRIKYTIEGGGINLLDSGKGTHDSDIESWVAYGTNTVAWDSDGGVGAVKCTFVNTGAGMYQYLRQTWDINTDLTVGAEYTLSAKVKINTGGAYLRVYDGVSYNTSAYINNTASYEWKTVTFTAQSTTGCIFALSNLGAGEIIWIDEWKIIPTGTLAWFGYLDSEQYSEDYSQATNYPVQFTGNNGFGILDKINFLDSGSKYTGLMTQWAVLEEILTHWGLLEYVTAIKVKLATDSAYFTIGAEETIFHQTYVKAENYYDEDDKPMSCREVLESILAPYGAFVTIIGTEVLLTDLHTLGTDASFTWVVYDNSLTYSTTEASEAIGDIETIGYYETGATLDILGGINKQVVKYSPYTFSNIEQDIQWNNDYIEPGSNMTFSSGSSPLYTVVHDGTTERAYNISGLDGWTFEGGSANLDRVTGYKETSTADPEFCLRIVNDNHWSVIGDGGTHDETLYLDTHSSYEWDVPYAIGGTPHHLKISGKIRALAGMWTNGADPDNGTDPYISEKDTDMSHFSLIARLWVGTQSFGQTVWNTSTNWFYIMAGKEDGSNATDSWHPFRTWRGGTSAPTGIYPITDEDIFIRLPLGVHGKIKIEFTPQIHAYPYSDPNSQVPLDGITEDIRSVEIKDIKIEVVTLPDKHPDNADIEYVGIIDNTWKDEGSTITLKHGTSGDNGVGSPFDSAGLIYDSGASDYRFIVNWVRNGNTAHLEELLLDTIQSNYETSTQQLSVNINNTSHTPFLRIEDNTYLSGTMLMFAGGTLDCAYNSLDCTLLEIKPDNLVLAP